MAYLNALKTKDEIIPAGGICMSGAVQESVGYYGDYWTAIGGSNCMFYWYTQTEHVNFKQILVSRCTV